MSVTLATTPRAPYTGRRTHWTRPDGRYSAYFAVPLAGLESTPENPSASQACQAVLIPMAHLTEVHGKVSAMVGRSKSTADAVSVAWVNVAFSAESDHDAGLTFTAVGREVGALGGALHYAVPTETGSTSERVMEVKVA